MNIEKNNLNGIKYVKNIIYNYMLEKLDLNYINQYFKNNINFKNEIKFNINAMKISQLYDNYNFITNKKGLYFIVTTNIIQANSITDNIKFKNGKTYKGKLYTKNILIEKYEKIKNNKYHNILYIGKAQCKNGLKERISKYINFGYGKCKNHAGGRAIWQLKNNDDFYVVWLQSDTIKDDFLNNIESCLIKNYTSNISGNSKTSMNYPFANWRI